MNSHHMIPMATLHDVKTLRKEKKHAFLLYNLLDRHYFQRSKSYNLIAWLAIPELSGEPVFIFASWLPEGLETFLACTKNHTFERRILSPLTKQQRNQHNWKDGEMLGKDSPKQSVQMYAVYKCVSVELQNINLSQIKNGICLNTCTRWRFSFLETWGF